MRNTNIRKVISCEETNRVIFFFNHHATNAEVVGISYYQKHTLDEVSMTKIFNAHY